MKRNIWISKMTKSRLERLLSKTHLSNDDKDDLLDFKYFLMNDKISAFEKGLMDAVMVSQPKETCDIGNCILLPKGMYWITNINHLTKDFNSKYNINIH